MSRQAKFFHPIFIDSGTYINKKTNEVIIMNKDNKKECKCGQCSCKDRIKNGRTQRRNRMVEYFLKLNKKKTI